MIELPQVHNVYVCAQPNVVGQIPADVVRIVIDDDVVAVPIPIAAITHIVGCNREEKAANAEAPRAAAAQSPYVAATDSSREATVLPRMVEVIMHVRSAGIVPDPTVVLGMHVWCLRMALFVGKCAPLSGRRPMRGRVHRGRPMCRNVPAAHSSFSSARVWRGCPLVWLRSAFVVLLREHRN